MAHDQRDSNPRGLFSRFERAGLSFLAAGAFSDSLARYVRRYVPHAALRLHMVEPQPRFAIRLASIAASHNATHHAAIAGEHDGSASLFTSRNSMTASTVATNAERYGQGKNQAHRDAVKASRPMISAPSIDLSRTMKQELHGRASAPVLLKMDVEGGEFALLPHLLVTGALCRVAYRVATAHTVHALSRS